MAIRLARREAHILSEILHFVLSRTHVARYGFVEVEELVDFARVRLVGYDKAVEASRFEEFVIQASEKGVGPVSQ